MSVAPRIPATPRESQALGFDAAPRLRSASATPGASRSRMLRVASGVTSRAVKPVIPAIGRYGIPLRDELILVRALP